MTVGLAVLVHMPHVQARAVACATKNEKTSAARNFTVSFIGVPPERGITRAVGAGNPLAPRRTSTAIRLPGARDAVARGAVRTHGESGRMRTRRRQVRESSRILAAGRAGGVRPRARPTLRAAALSRRDRVHEVDVGVGDLR